MTQLQYTYVPDVRAALYDTVIPAAIANLPDTITVAGSDMDLISPDLFYALPPKDTLPKSLIAVGFTGGGDDQVPVSWGDSPAQARTRDERFTVPLMIWYLTGSSDALAARRAAEASWAIYRAVAAEIRTDPMLAGAFPTPGHAHIAAVHDTDYLLAEGRASKLLVDVAVFTKV